MKVGLSQSQSEGDCSLESVIEVNLENYFSEKKNPHN